MIIRFSGKKAQGMAMYKDCNTNELFTQDFSFDLAKDAGKREVIKRLKDADRPTGCEYIDSMFTISSAKLEAYEIEDKQLKEWCKKNGKKIS